MEERFRSIEEWRSEDRSIAEFMPSLRSNAGSGIQVAGLFRRDRAGWSAQSVAHCAAPSQRVVGCAAWDRPVTVARSGPPCRRHASPEVDKCLFRNVDAERRLSCIRPQRVFFAYFINIVLFLSAIQANVYGVTVQDSGKEIVRDWVVFCYHPRWRNVRWCGTAGP